MSLEWLLVVKKKDSYGLFLVCEKLPETTRLLVQVVSHSLKVKIKFRINKESALDLEPGTFYRKIKPIPF